MAPHTYNSSNSKDRDAVDGGEQYPVVTVEALGAAVPLQVKSFSFAAYETCEQTLRHWRAHLQARAEPKRQAFMEKVLFRRQPSITD